MQDPILRIAKLRMIKMSADLEVALSAKHGSNIAIDILCRLRERAAESLAALATCDALDRKQVLILQNEVKRYDEWLGWMREILAEGKAYDQEITDDERNEMLDLLSESPEGQKRAVELGLIDEIPRDA